MTMFRIIIVIMLIVGMLLGIAIALSIKVKKIDWMPDIPPEDLE